jgi:hypothetical protein
MSRVLADRVGVVDAARAVVDRRAGAAHAPLDELAGASQFGDPSVDLGQFRFGEGSGCGSSRLVVGEQHLDLIEGEAGGLAQPDDLEAGQDRLVVAALAADSVRGP